jgi:hypothetical protein
MPPFNFLSDPFGAFLQEDPKMTYYGMQGQFGGSPRQKQYFEGQFGDIHNQFLGSLGSSMMQNQWPTQTWQGFLGQYPFTERFASLPPSFRGGLTGRFSPQTRFMY